MATSMTDPNALLMASLRPAAPATLPEVLGGWLDAVQRAATPRRILGGVALASVSFLLYRGLAASASSGVETAPGAATVRHGETLPVAPPSAEGRLITASAARAPTSALAPEPQRLEPLPTSPAKLDDALDKPPAKAKSRITKKKSKARVSRRTAKKASRSAEQAPRPRAPYSD
jgi:hypothetical protein